MADRAQTVTLEAVVAALLIVAAVAFSLQAVGISSNTANVGDGELRNQHTMLAEGLLDAAIENGSVRTTLLYWDEEEGQFYGDVDDDGVFTATVPNTSFGSALSNQLGAHQRNYNVVLAFPNESGSLETRTLIESGTPSTDAVKVSRTVTLYEDNQLVDANETPRDNVTLADVEEDYFAPNVHDDERVYTVVRVEVIVW